MNVPSDTLNNDPDANLGRAIMNDEPPPDTNMLDISGDDGASSFNEFLIRSVRVRFDNNETLVLPVKVSKKQIKNLPQNTFGQPVKDYDPSNVEALELDLWLIDDALRNAVLSKYGSGFPSIMTPNIEDDLDADNDNYSFDGNGSGYVSMRGKGYNAEAYNAARRRNIGMAAFDKFVREYNREPSDEDELLGTAIREQNLERGKKIKETSDEIKEFKSKYDQLVEATDNTMDMTDQVIGNLEHMNKLLMDELGKQKTGAKPSASIETPKQPEQKPVFDKDKFIRDNMTDEGKRVYDNLLRGDRIRKIMLENCPDLENLDDGDLGEIFRRISQNQDRDNTSVDGAIEDVRAYYEERNRRQGEELARLQTKIATDKTIYDDYMRKHKQHVRTTMFLGQLKRYLNNTQLIPDFSQPGGREGARGSVERLVEYIREEGRAEERSGLEPYYARLQGELKEALDSRALIFADREKLQKKYEDMKQIARTQDEELRKAREEQRMDEMDRTEDNSEAYRNLQDLLDQTLIGIEERDNRINQINERLAIANEANIVQARFMDYIGNLAQQITTSENPQEIYDAIDTGEGGEIYADFRRAYAGILVQARMNQLGYRTQIGNQINDIGRLQEAIAQIRGELDQSRQVLGETVEGANQALGRKDTEIAARTIKESVLNARLQANTEIISSLMRMRDISNNLHPISGDPLALENLETLVECPTMNLLFARNLPADNEVRNRLITNYLLATCKINSTLERSTTQALGSYYLMQTELGGTDPGMMSRLFIQSLAGEQVLANNDYIATINNGFLNEERNVIDVADKVTWIEQIQAACLWDLHKRPDMFDATLFGDIFNATTDPQRARFILASAIAYQGFRSGGVYHMAGNSYVERDRHGVIFQYIRDEILNDGQLLNIHSQADFVRARQTAIDRFSRQFSDPNSTIYRLLRDPNVALVPIDTVVSDGIRTMVRNPRIPGGGGAGEIHVPPNEGMPVRQIVTNPRQLVRRRPEPRPRAIEGPVATDTNMVPVGNPVPVIEIPDEPPRMPIPVVDLTIEEAGQDPSVSDAIPNRLVKRNALRRVIWGVEKFPPGYTLFRGRVVKVADVKAEHKKNPPTKRKNDAVYEDYDDEPFDPSTYTDRFGNPTKK